MTSLETLLSFTQALLMFTPTALSLMLNKYISFDRPNSLLISIHIFWWVLFILKELSFLYYFQGYLEPLSHYIYFYIINIAYVYALIGAVYLSGRKHSHKWFYLTTCVIFALTINLALKAVLDRFIYHIDFSEFLHFRYLKKFLIVNTARSLDFTIFAMLYCIAFYISAYRKKTLENENAYLQQQINPHLLFNTLNHIYAEVYPVSQPAAEAVQLLSEMQRYSVDAMDDDGKAPLSGEIAQIKNLIRLQQFRYAEPLILETNFEDNCPDFRIIPLSLLTLAENIFKHGNLRSPANPARLEVKCNDDGELLFHSRNLKKNNSGLPRRKGIGLRNLRLRLAYKYPGKHHLVINDQADIYELKLSISL
jgi:two-component system LytT family sensor kinase